MMINKSYTLKEYSDIINNALISYLPKCNYGESVVCDAMKYSSEIGGKRIRPVLTLEFCRICGGDINDAVAFACAVEMIHTYSLIHDDLPCMDDDDMRRGMPSCHIKFGESYALLAGDGLLTHAFKTLTFSPLFEKNPRAVAEAVRILSELSGPLGMIGGQVVDLKSEGMEVDLQRLSLMDKLKTGALIKCACLLGVIAAGGTTEQMIAAENYAEKVGQAFQIVDDILDVTADESELGKPVGSDAESNKSTYVTLLGLEESQKIADQLTDEAVKSLDVFEENSKFLKELAFMLAKRNK